MGEEKKEETRKRPGSAWLRFAALTSVLAAVALGSFYFLRIHRRERLLEGYYLRLLSRSADTVVEVLEAHLSQIADTAKEVNKQNLSSCVLKDKLALIQALRTGDETVGPTKALLVTELERGQGPATLRHRIAARTQQGERGWVNATTSLAELLGPKLPQDVFETLVLARADGEVLFQLRGDATDELRLLQLEESNGDASRQATGIAAATSTARVEIAGRDYRRYVQPLHLRTVLPLEIARPMVPAPPVAPMQGQEGAASGGAAAETASSAAPSPETTWVLAALRPADKLRAESMQISSTLVLFIGLALVLACLSLPLVRLLCLGPREQIHGSQLLALVVSVVLGVAFLSFGLVDVFSYRKMRSTRDEGLRSIAAQLNAAVGREAFLLADQLERLTLVVPKTQELDDAARSKVNLLEPAGCDVRYPFFEMAFWCDCDGKQVAKWTKRATTTPFGAYAARAYFQRVRQGHLWKISKSNLTDVDRGFAGKPALRSEYDLFIESIQSRTQGKNFATLSMRVPDGGICTPDGDYALPVAVIASEMLSLINPVLPRDHGFAVLDRDGLVLFHSDVERNLAENFYEELGAGNRLRAAAFAGACDAFDSSYRGSEVRVVAGPMALFPEWYLVVFAAREELRAQHLETLAFSFLIFGSLVLLLGFALLGLERVYRKQAPPRGALRLYWFWPNERHRARYRILLSALLGVVLFWGALSLVLTDPRALLAVAFALPIAAVAAAYVCLRYRHPLPAWLAAILPAAHGRDCELGTERARERARKRARAPWQTWRLRAWHQLYVWCVVALVFCVTALPAWTIYRAVFGEVARVNAIRQASELAEQLEDRGERLASELGDVRMSPEAAQLVAGLLGEPAGETSNGEFLDVFTPRSLAVKETRQRHSHETIRPVSWLYRLRDWVPIHGERSRRNFALSGWDEPIGCWSFGDHAFVLTSESYRPALREGRSRPTLEVRSIPLAFSVLDDDRLGPAQRVAEVFRAVRANPYETGVVLAVIALGVFGALTLARIVTPRIFLIDRLDPTMRDASVLSSDIQGTRSLYLRPSPQQLADLREGSGVLEIPAVDVRTASDANALRGRVQYGHARVILSQFEEDLLEEAVAERKLTLLESLLTNRSLHIALVAQIDPLHVIQSARRGDGETSVRFFERWAEALEPFQKIRCSLRHHKRREARKALLKRLKARRGSGVKSRALRRELVEECWPTDRLEEIAAELASSERAGELDPGNVVEVVGDLADAHYARIWSECSHDERVSLYRLAKGSWPTWRMQDTWVRLRRRGLVLATPSLHLMNESFRRFVLNAETGEQIERWAREGKGSTWARIRTPLSVGLAVLLALFYATQRQAFGQTIAMVSAVAAAGPAIIALGGMLAQGRRSTESDN